jgi:hypothetical protein
MSIFFALSLFLSQQMIQQLTVSKSRRISILQSPSADPAITLAVPADSNRKNVGDSWTTLLCSKGGSIEFGGGQIESTAAPAFLMSTLESE